jgi:rod shape-determining protein MreD
MQHLNRRVIFDSLWKRTILYFVLFFVISMVQIYFLDIIKIHFYLPDFLIILLVWITLREGVYIGLILSFFAGVIHDMYALNPLGFTALSSVSACFALKYLKSKDNYKKDLESLRFVVFTFIVTMISTFIKVLLTMNIFTENIEIYFIQQVLATSVYTSIFALFPVVIKFKPKVNY